MDCDRGSCWSRVTIPWLVNSRSAFLFAKLGRSFTATRPRSPKRAIEHFGNMKLTVSTRTALLALVSTSAFGADWPAFRGAKGDGIAQEDKAPLHCGPDKNIRWKAPLPDPGTSSPIVSRGRVF